MKTKIALVYGDKTFNVDVNELTKEQKKAIFSKMEIEQGKISKYHALKTEFTSLVDMHETNRALLENDSNMPVIERVKMLWEQKNLLTEIRTLRPKVEESGKEPLHFEEIAKERFDLMITGEDKESLMKAVEADKSLYETVVNTILETVKKEKEKKSSNS